MTLKKTDVILSHEINDLYNIKLVPLSVLRRELKKLKTLWKQYEDWQNVNPYEHMLNELFPDEVLDE